MFGGSVLLSFFSQGLYHVNLVSVQATLTVSTAFAKKLDLSAFVTRIGGETSASFVEKGTLLKTQKGNL